MPKIHSMRQFTALALTLGLWAMASLAFARDVRVAEPLTIPRGKTWTKAELLVRANDIDEPKRFPAHIFRQEEDAWVYGEINLGHSGWYEIDLHFEENGTPTQIKLIKKQRFDLDAVDVALVLDRSKSMERTDPNSVRFEALRQFIYLSRNSARIGNISLISFNHEAEVLFPMAPPSSINGTTEYEKSLTPAGTTNYTEALGVTLRILKRSGNREKVILFLSDGEPDTYHDIHLEANKNKAEGQHDTTIYTIALSEEADADLLSRIATETNGKFFKAPKAKQLPGIFSKIFRLLDVPKTVAKDQVIVQGTSKNALWLDGTMRNVRFKMIPIRGKITGTLNQRPLPIREDITTISLKGMDYGRHSLEFQGNGKIAYEMLATTTVSLKAHAFNVRASRGLPINLNFFLDGDIGCSNLKANALLQLPSGRSENIAVTYDKENRVYAMSYDPGERAGTFRIQLKITGKTLGLDFSRVNTYNFERSGASIARRSHGKRLRIKQAVLEQPTGPGQRVGITKGKLITGERKLRSTYANNAKLKAFDKLYPKSEQTRKVVIQLFTRKAGLSSAKLRTTTQDGVAYKLAGKIMPNQSSTLSVTVIADQKSSGIKLNNAIAITADGDTWEIPITGTVNVPKITASNARVEINKVPDEPFILNAFSTAGVTLGPEGEAPITITSTVPGIVIEPTSFIANQSPVDVTFVLKVDQTLDPEDLKGNIIMSGPGLEDLVIPYGISFEKAEKPFSLLDLGWILWVILAVLIIATIIALRYSQRKTVFALVSVIAHVIVLLMALPQAKQKEEAERVTTMVVETFNVVEQQEIQSERAVQPESEATPQTDSAEKQVVEMQEPEPEESKTLEAEAVETPKETPKELTEVKTEVAREEQKTEEIESETSTFDKKQQETETEVVEAQTQETERAETAEQQQEVVEATESLEVEKQERVTEKVEVKQVTTEVQRETVETQEIKQEVTEVTKKHQETQETVSNAQQSEPTERVTPTNEPTPVAVQATQSLAVAKQQRVNNTAGNLQKVESKVQRKTVQTKSIQQKPTTQTTKKRATTQKTVSQAAKQSTPTQRVTAPSSQQAKPNAVKARSLTVNTKAPSPSRAQPTKSTSLQKVSAKVSRKSFKTATINSKTTPTKASTSKKRATSAKTVSHAVQQSAPTQRVTGATSKSAKPSTVKARSLTVSTSGKKTSKPTSKTSLQKVSSKVSRKSFKTASISSKSTPTKSTSTKKRASSKPATTSTAQASASKSTKATGPTRSSSKPSTAPSSSTRSLSVATASTKALHKPSTMARSMPKGLTRSKKFSSSSMKNFSKASKPSKSVAKGKGKTQAKPGAKSSAPKAMTSGKIGRSSTKPSSKPGSTMTARSLSLNSSVKSPRGPTSSIRPSMSAFKPKKSFSSKLSDFSSAKGKKTAKATPSKKAGSGKPNAKQATATAATGSSSSKIKSGPKKVAMATGNPMRTLTIGSKKFKGPTSKTSMKGPAFKSKKRSFGGGALKDFKSKAKKKPKPKTKAKVATKKGNGKPSQNIDPNQIIRDALAGKGSGRIETSGTAQGLDGKGGGEKGQGTFIRGYYKNGQLQYEIPYDGNAASGTVKQYFANGNKFSTIQYTSGGRDGQAQYHYESGELYIRKGYKDGQLDGEKLIFYESGSIQSGTLSALTKAASDNNAQIRASAIKSMGKMGSGAAARAQLIANAVNDSNKKVKKEAIIALGKLGASAAATSVPTLIAVVQNGSADMRKLAIKALAKIGPAAKDAIELLTQLAAQDNYDAVKALKKIQR